MSPEGREMIITEELRAVNSGGSLSLEYMAKLCGLPAEALGWDFEAPKDVWDKVVKEVQNDIAKAGIDEDFGPEDVENGHPEELPDGMPPEFKGLADEGSGPKVIE